MTTYSDFMRETKGSLEVKKTPLADDWFIDVRSLKKQPEITSARRRLSMLAMNQSYQQNRVILEDTPSNELYFAYPEIAGETWIEKPIPFAFDSSNVTWFHDPIEEGREYYRSEIKESDRLLELNDDWDGEGAEGYTQDTRDKAVEFLLKHAAKIKELRGTWIPAPSIDPGPYGSIDLTWEMNDRELTINIPKDENESASYYGDDLKDGTTDAVRGINLDINAVHEWIFLWLIR